MAAQQARSFSVAWRRRDAGPAPVAAMISALVDRLEKRPGEAFALFALAHAAVWTVLPATLYPNLPLDLIEALTYGREWQLGYDKLPPLPWWLIEATYRLFGSDTALYLVAQATVVAAFCLVWVLARRLVGPIGALVAVLIVDGLHYFNFTAPKFNHDVIQLPLWALAGVSFHGALRSGRLRDWAGLGLACGLALWAKYFIAVLALPLALFLLLDRDARGILDHVVHPLVFVVGQIVWLLPSGLIALPLVRPRREVQKSSVDAFDRRIVTLLAFGPAALLIAGSVITGRGLIAMWGYPLWLFVGLWVVIATGTATEWARARRAALAWGAVTALYAVAFVLQYGVLPFVDHRYRASLFPGDRLGAEISTRFRAATGAPLAYVIGSMWLGGNISR